jgi:hypothetical protein
MLENTLSRRFVLLAPSESWIPFGQAVEDVSHHEQLLGAAQRLRGRIYVQDGALRPRDLSMDGRHIEPADALSWHLLTVDQNQAVTACIRYLAHPPGVSFSELLLSRSLMGQTPDFVRTVRRTVQAELDRVSRLGFSYVELGGWALGEELRCSTEAIRMLLMMYALSQSLGGALAISTATTRHHSSSILRRVGGTRLVEHGKEISPYFDPNYNCEMDLVSFDSRTPSPCYAERIEEFREALFHIPVIAGAGNLGFTGDLLRLHYAAADSQSAPSLRRQAQVYSDRRRIHITNPSEEMMLDRN